MKQTEMQVQSMGRGVHYSSQRWIQLMPPCEACATRCPRNRTEDDGFTRTAQERFCNDIESVTMRKGRIQPTNAPSFHCIHGLLLANGSFCFLIGLAGCHGCQHKVNACWPRRKSMRVPKSLPGNNNLISCPPPPSPYFREHKRAQNPQIRLGMHPAIERMTANRYATIHSCQQWIA